MKRDQRWIILAAMTLVFAAGCTTQGAYVKPKESIEIQDSVTSAQQLEAALGAPSVTIPKEDGTIMWVYEGIHTRPGATSYIPYLSVLIGRTVKDCTRLAVLVDRATGKLSEWNYATASDTDFRAFTDDKCVNKKQ